MIAPVMARANWVVENPAETTLELDYGKLETFLKKTLYNFSAV